MNNTPTIKELQRKGIISPNIPNTCVCGGDIAVTESQAYFFCTNPNCTNNLANSILKALRALRIYADIGIERATLIADNFPDIKNAMEIFRSEYITAYFPSSMNKAIQNELETCRKKILQQVLKINEDGIFLANFLEAFDFHRIGTIYSKDITREVKDPEELFLALHSQGAKFISKSLKVGEHTDTVQSIYTTLMDNEDMIKDIAKTFKFKELGSTKTYDIAITGAITKIKDEYGGKIKPRERLEDVLYNLYGVKIIIRRPKDDFQTFDYLIMDESMEEHKKFNKAIEVEKQRGTKLIINSYEFEKIIVKDLGLELDPSRINPDLEYASIAEEDIVNDKIESRWN